MKRRIVMAAVGMMGMLMPGLAIAGELPTVEDLLAKKELPTVEDLLAKMTAAISKIKSFEADIQITSSSQRGTGSGTGRVETKRYEHDAKTIEKAFFSLEMIMKLADGKEVAIARKVVVDGTFIWFEGRNSQRKEIMVGEKAINGRKAYLVEAGSKDAGPGGLAKMDVMRVKYWVDKEDLLIRRKTVTMGGTKTLEYLNVKVNGKVDEKLFEYTPPEGVEVKDYTKN